MRNVKKVLTEKSDVDACCFLHRGRFDGRRNIGRQQRRDAPQLFVVERVVDLECIVGYVDLVVERLKADRTVALDEHGLVSELRRYITVADVHSNLWTGDVWKLTLSFRVNQMYSDLAVDKDIGCL